MPFFFNNGLNKIKLMARFYNYKYLHIARNMTRFRCAVVYIMRWYRRGNFSKSITVLLLIIITIYETGPRLSYCKLHDG